MPVYFRLGGGGTGLQWKRLAHWRVSIEISLTDLVQHPVIQASHVSSVSSGKTPSVKLIRFGCAHSVLISLSFLSTVAQNLEPDSSRYTACCKVC